jgi:hypothetical protein
VIVHPTSGETAEAGIPDEGYTAEELGPGSSGAHRNLHDRMRSLSPIERTELARLGSLPERVALERCFGGSVWEGLLQTATHHARGRALRQEQLAADHAGKPDRTQPRALAQAFGPRRCRFPHLLHSVARRLRPISAASADEIVRAGEAL